VEELDVVALCLITRQEMLVTVRAVWRTRDESTNGPILTVVAVLTFIKTVAKLGTENNSKVKIACRMYFNIILISYAGLKGKTTVPVYLSSHLVELLQQCQRRSC
jgi:hypothetical protein